MSVSTPFMADGSIVKSERIIYTPQDFAKTNLNHLQEVGTLTALRVHESRRSELSSYLCFIVLGGSGSLTVNGISYELKAGDCAFVDCMLNYRHKSSEELWQLKWVHFNGPSMTGIYDKYRDRGGKYVFTPSGEDFLNLSSILDEIHRVAGSVSYIRDMEINERLTAILTILMRNSWNPERSEESSQKRKKLRDVRDYLNAHFGEEITLDELAGMFYINKFYLTRIFKEQYGTSVNKYLTQVRITNAKKSLRFTGLSIEQIGNACGYKDANFFIRTFKRCEGLTPGEFRSKWQS